MSRRTSLGAAAPTDEHRADHQIGVIHRLFDGMDRRVDGRGARAEDLLKLAEARDGAVDDRDLRPHADRHAGCVRAHHAAAQDYHVGGRHAGDAAEQDTAPALLLLKAVGAGLDRHTARDLAHRREQRQPAARIGHGLVGDGDTVGIDQGVGLGGVGRKVEIGEEHLVGPQHGALGRLRFLHLHDHLGRAKNLRRVIHHLGTGALVVLVEEPDLSPGVLLDHDLMAMLHELAHTAGRNADAVLVDLGLLGNADEHGRSFPKYDESHRDRP